MQKRWQTAYIIETKTGQHPQNTIIHYYRLPYPIRLAIILLGENPMVKSPYEVQVNPSRRVRYADYISGYNREQVLTIRNT